MRASAEVKRFLKEAASKGGKARSKKLSKARRSEIARLGGEAKAKKNK